MTNGERFNAWRKKKGWSYDKVAREFEMTAGSIYMLCSGKITDTPNIRTLKTMKKHGFVWEVK